MGPVARSVRGLIHQLVMEHELDILEGNVARDHVRRLIAYRPHQSLSLVARWPNGLEPRMLLEESGHFRWPWLGRRLWVRRYFRVASATITDVGIKQHIGEREGERVRNDSSYRFDKRLNLPPSRR